MSEFDPPEDERHPIGEVTEIDGVKGFDLSAVIGQLTAPFADIDIPPGFEHIVESRLLLTALVLKGLQNSTNPQDELRRLESAAGRAYFEDSIPEFGRLNRVTAERIQNRGGTSLKLETGDKTDLIEKLTAKSDSSRLSLLRSGNSWGYERQYEPFEHTGIEAVGMNITTNPRTGRSDASLHMKIHTEAAAGEEDSIIGALLQVRKVGREIFRYQIPGHDEEAYRTRQGKGRGLVYEADDGSRIIIEMSGQNLKMTHSVSVKAPETTTEDEEITDEEAQKIKEEQVQAELKTVVERQLSFVEVQFPAFIEHVATIWDKKLPEESITIRVGSNSGDLGLFDFEDDKDLDEITVPEEITDPRQKSLYVQTVQPQPNTTFEMIGGLSDEVRRVKQAISKAMHPERYESAGLNPRSTVLLVGPPGTGKTMLAEAVATEINGTFLSAKGSDIMSMWAGEAEKNVASLFDLVEVLGKEHKVVLFLDEIEAVAPSRSSQYMMEHERKITAEFLSALNRKYPNAIIIGATNAPANVDAAVTRPGRFTDIVTIGNPDRNGRLHIINNWLNYYIDRASIEVFNGVNPEDLADASEGLNGADLRTIIESAIVNEVELALEEEREFKSLGTVALLGHMETHKASSVERFSNYLGAPSGGIQVRLVES